MKSLSLALALAELVPSLATADSVLLACGRSPRARNYFSCTTRLPLPSALTGYVGTLEVAGG
jgi:hypothetical protein